MTEENEELRCEEDASRRVAEQQLCLMAELLLCHADTDAFKAVIGVMAESHDLRKKVAMIIRDHCAATMRPEVEKFAGLMEMKLRKHDPVRGERWKTGDAEHHIERIESIVEELHNAIHSGLRVGLKSADLANHAMMLADQFGELDDV